MGVLRVPQARWFDAASTLVHYILGAVSQNARIDGDTSGIDPDADRAEFFDATSAAWQELNPEDHPFMHAVVGGIREHDDREQFLTGITVVLDGLTRLRGPIHRPVDPAGRHRGVGRLPRRPRGVPAGGDPLVRPSGESPSLEHSDKRLDHGFRHLCRLCGPGGGRYDPRRCWPVRSAGRARGCGWVLTFG